MYHRVLVPVDFCACSLSAVQQAAQLSRRLGAKSTLLHVVTRGASAAERHVAHEELVALATQASFAAPPSLLVREADGVTERILQCARYERADLILMGARGERAGRTELGAVAHAVAAGATVPVQIMPTEIQTPAHRWLLAVGMKI